VLCERDSRKNTVDRQMQNSCLTLTNILNRIKKISSQSDIDDIVRGLDNTIQFLPTLTVQKLLRIDQIDFGDFAEVDYRRLLESLISKFDHSFPTDQGQMFMEVKKIFAVEDHNFFAVACDVITKNLKTKDFNVADSLSFLTEITLKSEGCFALIFHNFYSLESENEFEVEENFAQWQNMIRTLLSLPNRISNALQGQFRRFYTSNEYCKFLVFNILKVIEFTSDLLITEPEHEQKFNYRNLSLLLSKTLINYNEHFSSEAIKNFIKIVATLTNQNSCKQKIYQKCFWSLFDNLERTAVEIFAVMILQNLDPTVYSVRNVLGPNLIKNDNWKFVFCTKIPLLSQYSDNNLINNLVVYISATSEHNLFALLANLVTVWSDKSALNHTSVEHHFYLTKIIVVIMNSLKNIGLTESERRILQGKVYAGVPIHLENSINEIRAMGMKASEIILNFLNQESEKDKADSGLNFKYDSLPAEAKASSEMLQKLFDYDMSVYYKKKNVTDDASELISQLLEVKLETVEYVPPERKLRNVKNQEQPQNTVIAEAIHQRNNLITIIDSTDFELDSDDDLEPYDLSNDVKVSKKSPPKYLRDLRDGLLETQDAELFTSSVEICEDLIIKQLPDDDASLGIEILQILIALDQRFYVDNFDSLVFKSCVAITCVYPAQCAEYLCKEFHADIGTYSISHRIFVLDVLSEAADALSNLKPDKVEETPVVKKIKKKSSELESAEEIIRKRLESKTRYFHKHKFFRVEKLNKFANVAGYFFFPLLYGYNKNKMISQIPQNDSDFILLIHFIRTLAVVMCSAQNCPIAPRMAKEILHFSWYLRFHKEVKVRMAVISLIGAAVINTPKERLISDFIDELLEFRLWLGDLLSLNIARGEPNLECRTLAASTMCIIDSILKVEDE
jgi:hypothetical protein